MERSRSCRFMPTWNICLPLLQLPSLQLPSPRPSSSPPLPSLQLPPNIVETQHRTSSVAGMNQLCCSEPKLGGILGKAMLDPSAGKLTLLVGSQAQSLNNMFLLLLYTVFNHPPKKRLAIWLHENLTLSRIKRRKTKKTFQDLKFRGLLVKMKDRNSSKPIGSMYGIFTYIWLNLTVNVNIPLPRILLKMDKVFPFWSVSNRWRHPILVFR